MNVSLEKLPKGSREQKKKDKKRSQTRKTLRFRPKYFILIYLALCVSALLVLPENHVLTISPEVNFVSLVSTVISRRWLSLQVILPKFVQDHPQI